MREFLNAPKAVRDDFTARLARQAQSDTEESRWLHEVMDDDPVPPRLPEVTAPARRLVWDDSWSKRARFHARPQAGGRDFGAERTALKAIEPSVYFPVLTGHEARTRLVCVLPGHDDERTASLRVYAQDGWFCFGCQRGGGIYELAAELWGLSTRGRDFRELHDRLCELMGVRS